MVALNLFVLCFSGSGLMYALIDRDLLVGRTTESQSHGIKLMSSSYYNLRFDGREIVDISSFDELVFYIDADGVKHIIEGEGWQELTCSFDDDLVLDGGVWRIRNAQGDLDAEIQRVLDLRSSAYKLESDPLYIEWQFDQTEEGEQLWRDKVLEIKERYPIPTE